MSSHPSPGYPKRWKGNIFVRENKNQSHLFPERRQHKIVLKKCVYQNYVAAFCSLLLQNQNCGSNIKKMTQISETSAFSQPSLFQKLHKLTFMVSHRSIQLLQRKGLYFGALLPHQHHFTNTSQSTHVNPRPGRKSSAAQEGGGIPGVSISAGPRFTASGAGKSQHSSPGCVLGAPGAFFPLYATD